MYRWGMLICGVFYLQQLQQQHWQSGVLQVLYAWSLQVGPAHVVCSSRRRSTHHHANMNDGVKLAGKLSCMR